MSRAWGAFQRTEAGETNERATGKIEYVNTLTTVKAVYELKGHNRTGVGGLLGVS